VRSMLQETARRVGLPLEIRPDHHFFATIEQFRQHAAGRKQLRLEYFYRELRRQTGVLMDGDQPVGGKWNLDAENRHAFSRHGPGDIPTPMRFSPDQITLDVLRLITRRFPSHPGSLEHFDWPVTRQDALRALDDFCSHRLPQFGRYQDAMWTGEPYLFHSRLSASMNLKLLTPREVVARAVHEFQAGNVPLPAAEGFIRQILGWREYVRGIYWTMMPSYLERNELMAEAPLPDWYWTGETEMQCLRQTLRQTLDLGYAHHIQRLMVTGLYTLLLGVQPRRVHEWYLAVYVDAVEWVELPNTLGMSQYADGGVMASKPYVATGKYLDRMSNYCHGCRFRPDQATGERACPFTTLYWDFLGRHAERLESNQRMALQLKNWKRKAPDERRAIQEQAARCR
jgi:deoxyribodipyrimidine photolyase-related protein